RQAGRSYIQAGFVEQSRSASLIRSNLNCFEKQKPQIAFPMLRLFLYIHLLWLQYLTLIICGKSTTLSCWRSRSWKDLSSVCIRVLITDFLRNLPNTSSTIRANQPETSIGKFLHGQTDSTTKNMMTKPISAARS